MKVNAQKNEYSTFKYDVHCSRPRVGLYLSVRTRERTIQRVCWAGTEWMNFHYYVVVFNFSVNHRRASTTTSKTPTTGYNNNNHYSNVHIKPTRVNLHAYSSLYIISMNLLNIHIHGRHIGLAVLAAWRPSPPTQLSGIGSSMSCPASSLSLTHRLVCGTTLGRPLTGRLAVPSQSAHDPRAKVSLGKTLNPNLPPTAVPAVCEWRVLALIRTRIKTIQSYGRIPFFLILLGG